MLQSKEWATAFKVSSATLLLALREDTNTLEFFLSGPQRSLLVERKMAPRSMALTSKLNRIFTHFPA